jgi:hypothetical protein
VIATQTKDFHVVVTVNLDHAQGDEFELVRNDLLEAMSVFDHDPGFVRIDVVEPVDLRLRG